MATKVFFYTLRPYDELGIAQRLAPQMDIEFGYSQDYPTLENAELAKGYDAVSVTPCDMSAPMVKRFHELGIKSICCRSIGYDHVDRETARALGMKVANVDYPPNGVANFAIMLMLMSLRKAGHILKRGEAQDYSLKGKIGRDISGCTVGVIGTGRIGRTVLQHLSGFGCRLLAYDLYPNEDVKKIAEYVPLETLLKECDVITLHTNATAENHHLIDAKAIETMKPGAVIINTARGKLIDSDALIAGLESGKLGGAALDVLENENGLYYYNRMGDVIPNPELAAQFQAAYEESVQWVLDHPAEAAALAEEYLGMKAAIVEAAIPNMGLTFKSAQDAKEELDTFYNLLYNFEPSMIGGKLPDEGLFYAG